MSGIARRLILLGLVSLLVLQFSCAPPATEVRRPGTNASQAVDGRVISGDKPVTGATVRYKGTADSVPSDYDGRFRLPPRKPEATVTASKEGFIIGGIASSASRPLTIPLTPLPSHDSEDYVWVEPTPDSASSGNCGNCHQAIYDEWKADGHSRGLGNPRFLDLYEANPGVEKHADNWSLVEEHPEGAGVCAACHAPSAALDHLSVGDIRAVDAIAAQGVHCDYCHKVREVALEPSALGLTHGRFGMQLLRPSPHEGHGQLFFGPLDDVDRGEDSYASVFRESRYCAACHEGTVFGVPVYSTYSEWLASPAKQANRSCQSCHMAPTGKMTNIAPENGGIERDAMTLGSHTMLPGGRAAMLRRCLNVKVEVRREQGSVRTEVQVRTQNVGHRVPTGFIDRHLILVVEAFDTDQQSVNVSAGPILPAAAGDLASRPGRIFAKRWTDDQDRPIPFWRAGGTLTDQRLAPDTTTSETFAFPAQADSIRVRLLFRSFWHSTTISKRWEDDTIVVFDETKDLETAR